MIPNFIEELSLILRLLHDRLGGRHKAGWRKNGAIRRAYSMGGSPEILPLGGMAINATRSLESYIRVSVISIGMALSLISLLCLYRRFPQF